MVLRRASFRQRSKATASALGGTLRVAVLVTAGAQADLDAELAAEALDDGMVGVADGDDVRERERVASLDDRGDVVDVEGRMADSAEEAADHAAVPVAGEGPRAEVIPGEQLGGRHTASEE